MNLSQVLEGVVSKPTWFYDKKIKENPDKMCTYLELLNKNVLRYLGNDDYYNNVSNLINLCRNDKNVYEDVLNDITKTNLFCEVPSFTKINLRELLKHAYPSVNENIIIKKEMIDYMKQRLGCFKDLVIPHDIKIPNIYVAPIYIQKLHKIADKLVSVRSLGPTKLLTNQPLRGRARGGGSRIGQMEIEAIIANGCEKSLREFFTIKNDWPQSEKEKMIETLISSGYYTLPEMPEESVSKTNVLVNVILDFLKK